MKRILMGLAISGLLLTSNTAIQAAKWDIDPAHTEIGFKIRHLVSKTKGRFSDYTGSIEFNEKKPEKLKATAVIKTASVDTANQKRDDHLRNKDFFDVEKYPEITFKSTGAKKDKDGNLKLMGDFTLLGVTKPITLDVEIGGVMNDPWGNERVGFSATGEISRKEFGMGYNTLLDTGGTVIGDKVILLLEIEGIKQKKK